MIECKRLGRNGIGVELNPKVVFNLLGIDVGIVRQKCALLPLKALHKGLETWR